MAGTATIVGGAKVTLSLDPGEYAAAQQALSAIGKGYTHGFVLDNVNNAPQPGALNIYNVLDPAGPGGHGHGNATYHLNAGAQGIVLTGNEAATILGRTTQEGFTTLQNGISMKHRAIEFLRSGAYPCRARTGSLNVLDSRLALR